MIQKESYAGAKYHMVIRYRKNLFMHAGSRLRIPVMSAFLPVIPVILQPPSQAGDATHDVRIQDTTRYRNAGINPHPDARLIILSGSETSPYLLEENPHWLLNDIEMSYQWSWPGNHQRRNGRRGSFLR